MKKIKILDFYAEWCQPCKAFAPTLNELEHDYPDIDFEKVNIEDDTDTTSKYGVMSIPTLVFIVDDEEKARMTGVAPRDAVVQKITELKN